LNKTIITDKISYVEPDSMSQFTSCAGLIFKSTQSGAKVLIDTNMGCEETPALIEKEQPDMVMITHFHLDHSAFTRYVAEYSDAQILISKKDLPFLTSFDFMVKNTAGLMGMADQWRDFAMNKLKFRPLKRYEGFIENEYLSDLIPEMLVVPTPGHSPGHTSFYFPADKILFAGDIGLDRFGPWYGWKNCSIQDIVESLLRLDSMDINLILTSHGGMIEKNIHQAFSHSLAHIQERERMIIEKLDKGIKEEDIIKQGVFYKRRDKAPEAMRSFLHMWDTAMFDHHMALIREGGVLKHLK
jgi:hydroxyacylglutathione hydrolase